MRTLDDNRIRGSAADLDVRIVPCARGSDLDGRSPVISRVAARGAEIVAASAATRGDRRGVRRLADAGVRSGSLPRPEGARASPHRAAGRTLRPIWRTALEG